MRAARGAASGPSRFSVSESVSPDRAVHHQERRLARRRLEVEDLNDVWVAEGGGGAGLTLEARQGLRAGFRREITVDQLDGDAASEIFLLGLDHHAHAAPAQQAPEPVAPTEQASFEVSGARHAAPS